MVNFRLLHLQFLVILSPRWPIEKAAPPGIEVLEWADFESLRSEYPIDRLVLKGQITAQYLEIACDDVCCLLFLAPNFSKSVLYGYSVAFLPVQIMLA